MVLNGKQMYSLDRTAFKAQKKADQPDSESEYKTMTWQERVKIVMYLNSIAFKIANNYSPTMDKNLFSKRTRK